MEIDPDVAAILDDLPATKLPEVLVQRGWGAETAAEAQHRSVWAKTRIRSTTFQPTMEPCVQCGRPVARNHQGETMDHAGNKECDSAIAERYVHHHVTQEQLDDVKRWTGEYSLKRWKQRQEFQVPGAIPVCHAKRDRGHDHVHECEHPITHFGFHECKVCHHLWH